MQVGKSKPSMVLSWIELLEKASLMTYGRVHDALNLVEYSTIPTPYIIIHMLGNNVCFFGHLSNTTFLRFSIASRS